MSNRDNAPTFVYDGSGRALGMGDATRVRVDPSVKKIEVRAFIECREITAVDFPEGITLIAAAAFARCSSLEHAAIPSTTKVIGEEAFTQCKALRAVVLFGGLLTIGAGAFSYCASLSSIDIPPTVEGIGRSAFWGCKNLREVKLREGLKRIGEFSFRHCSSLIYIKIPSSVSIICHGVFYHCRALKSVDLCEGITKIEEGAFAYCSSMESIRIPSTVEEIGDDAFSRCKNLVKVEICEGVRTIGKRAFVNCSTLLQINIPSSVKEISPGAFRGCNLLRDVAIDPNSRIPHYHHIFGNLPRCRLIKDVQELKGRFNALPVHELCHQYSRQHNNGTSEIISAVEKVSEHDLTENLQHQDCLGMTYLHILACSANRNVELYRFLVEKYPGHLTTKDYWGNIPFNYVIYGQAPLDVLQFFFASHSKYFEEMPFDFEDQIKRIAFKDNTSLEFLKDLIRAQRASFPKLVVDWDGVTDYFVNFKIPGEMFRLFVQVGVSNRLESFSLSCRREITNRIAEIPNFTKPRKKRRRLRLIRALIDYCELQEAMTILEMALWKARLEEGNCRDREACHVNCGVEIVANSIMQLLKDNRCLSDLGPLNIIILL